MAVLEFSEVHTRRHESREIARGASWRQADRVAVSGKLNWPSFQAQFAIGITTVENNDAAGSEP